jgi:hypothetical protein
MLSTIPIKKRLKVLLQLNYTGENEYILMVSKISHILSQYNVFESHLVDDYFTKLFKNFNFIPKISTWRFIGSLKLPVIIDIYKKKYKTDIIICGFDLSSLCKKLMDRRFMLSSSKTRRKNKNGLYLYSVMEIFKINVISNLFFYNLTNFNYLNFKKKFKKFNLVLKNIKDRFFMKSRKINFKRKDKKKNK